MLKQMFRFGIVGVSATVVHVAVFTLFATLFGITAGFANVLGYLPAVLVSYYGQSRWTFAADGLTRGDHRRRFSRFILTSGLSFALNSVVVYLVVTLAGYPPYAASPIMLTLVPALTFMLNRSWAFRTAAVREQDG